MPESGRNFRHLPVETLTVLVQSFQKGFYRFNETMAIEARFLRKETSLSYQIPYGVAISMIGVVGETRGGISIILDQPGFSRYVSALTGGMIRPDVENSIAMSSVGEMLNMVAGRMATEMSKVGFSIDITPPQTFCGERIRQVESSKTAHMILPYSLAGSRSDSGVVHLVVNSLKD